MGVSKSGKRPPAYFPILGGTLQNENDVAVEGLHTDVSARGGISYITEVKLAL